MTMADKKQDSSLGNELIAGMNRAVAYARGEIELPTPVVVVPPLELAAIRKKLGLNRARFAAAVGVSPMTVKIGSKAAVRTAPPECCFT